MFDVVTLPEPMRLRDFEAQEHKKLSDFQEDIVQLAAILKGHQKADFEEMTVAEAAKYTDEAFQVFMEECVKAHKNGAAEDHVVVIQSTEQEMDHSDNKADVKPKSFFQKLISCSGW